VCQSTIPLTGFWLKILICERQQAQWFKCVDPSDEHRSGKEPLSSDFWLADA